MAILLENQEVSPSDISAKEFRSASSKENMENMEVYVSFSEIGSTINPAHCHLVRLTHVQNDDPSSCTQFSPKRFDLGHWPFPSTRS